MFLNYKRIPLVYIVLSILTLGYYSVVYRQQAARDFNIAVGMKMIEVPSGKEMLLHYVTLGIYTMIWDMKFLSLCEVYIKENGKESELDFESYRFLAAVPIVRFLAVKNFVSQINLVCRIYSDKQLEDVDASDLTFNRVREVNIDDIYTPAKQIDTSIYDFSAEKMEMEKPKAVEKEKEADEVDEKKHESRMIAGHAVVEEYDPTRDYRRIGYQLRFEREEKIAEREEEEKRRIEAEEQAKSLAKGNTNTVPVIVSHRSKMWFVKVVALTLLVFILPFAAVVTTIFAFPSVYDESYVGSLSKKYELLNSINDKKIVIIGGDSVAMGISSQTIEDELPEYRIVNFGMDSELGMKMLIDLSRSAINSGDIIIISPELNAQSMSLNFNGEKALEALDGNFELLMQIDSGDYSALLGSSVQFATNKLGYIFEDKKPTISRPAYAKGNFDDYYGDNIYNRPLNETFGLYNPVNFEFKINMKDSEVTEYEEFIQYINEFTHYAERKGATVYFTFSPICKAAIDSSVSEKSISAFFDNICENLQCRVISDINNCIMDEGYFYDSEFNLNDAGKIARSLMLVDDIKREMLNETQNSETKPVAPGYTYPTIRVESSSDITNAEDFEFEMILLKNGNDYAHYYSICGVSEQGFQKELLTLPNVHNGIPVVGISANAFKEAPYLKEIELSKNIAVIAADAFAGSSVKKVYFADGIKPYMIFIGQSISEHDVIIDKGITFYVNAENLSAFQNDNRMWSKYANYIEAKS